MSCFVPFTLVACVGVCVALRASLYEVLRQRERLRTARQNQDVGCVFVTQQADLVHVHFDKFENARFIPVSFEFQVTAIMFAGSHSNDTGCKCN